MKKDPWVEIEAVIPQIGAAMNPKWQSEINEVIKLRVEGFIRETLESAQKTKEMYPQAAFPHAGLVDYEVRLNKGGLLSLTLTFYQYTGGAHGMTYLEAINLDLTTGQVLEFEDVLPEPAQRARLAEIINGEVKKDPARFLIPEFTADMFQEPQGFYLQEKSIVVYFGLYEIAPYVSGIQKFTFPLE
ncbi:MAG: DUF3298 and DUF4163 domain-containing protein [Firmicutes bacterium]|nr:DUF3298 and DUF4163 domain-containing protein [Bacillota bacterium]